MNKKEKAEVVAESICNKTKKETFDECSKHDKKFKICKLMNKCRIEEKSEEQLEYILSDINENIFLEACPGSGKTEVLALKAAYEINRWNKKTGMAFLTFTNEAADVINQRVKECSNSGRLFPHFIGTLHSFIHGYISQPYGYKFIDYTNEYDKSLKIVDDKDRNKGWLEQFRIGNGKIIQPPLYANQIYYNLGNIIIKEGRKEYTIEEYYERETIQKKVNKYKINYSKEKFKKSCVKKKKEFLSSGNATFDDMLYIAYKVLMKDKKICEKLAKRFPIIFIDECQDLSEIEIKIIDKLKQKGTKIHLVGDLNQAIYEYKKAVPEVIEEYVNENNFKIMKLNRCFRCNQTIVNTFQKIVGKEEIKGNKDNQLIDSCIFINYGDMKYNDLIKWYNEYCDKNLGKKSSRVILTRGNGLKNKLLVGNDNNMKLPDIINYWNNGNSICKKKALELFGKLICKEWKSPYNKGNFGCPSTVSSVVMWKKFLINILKETYKINKYDMLYTKWYKGARQILNPLILRSYNIFLKEYDEKDNSSKLTTLNCFRVPRGEGNKLVKLNTMDTNLFNNINTVHAVKGQTFDSIMLVSNDKQIQGTNWKEWLKEKNSEYARIAYVASSRAKELLVWALPNPKDKDKKKLEDYGIKEIKNIFQDSEEYLIK